jgi:hypothetical protein
MPCPLFFSLKDTEPSNAEAGRCVLKCLQLYQIEQSGLLLYLCNTSPDRHHPGDSANLSVLYLSKLRPRLRQGFGVVFLNEL